MSHGKCTKCGKTVYLQEGFKVGPPGKEIPFHKGCFKCSNPGCTWQLNLTNYKFCDGKAYCSNHNPMTGFSNESVKVKGNTSIEDKGMKMQTNVPKLDNVKSNVLISDNKHSQTETLINIHVKNAPRQGVHNNQNLRGINNNTTTTTTTTSNNTSSVVTKTEETKEEKPIEKKPVEKKPETKKEEPKGKIECLGGKRWNVENFKGNKEIKLENVERSQVVYLYNLQDCIVEVTAEKFASISVDKVSKTGIKFTKSIGSLEVVNSNKVQIQGSAPSYNIDKSDGITLYLTPEDTDSQIISSKAEINIVLLEGDEPVETPIPSQFITTFDTKKNDWVTKPTDHVGA